jgi:hypothetical protein
LNACCWIDSLSLSRSDGCGATIRPHGRIIMATALLRRYSPPGRKSAMKDNA